MLVLKTLPYNVTVCVQLTSFLPASRQLFHIFTDALSTPLVLTVPFARSPVALETLYSIPTALFLLIYWFLVRVLVQEYITGETDNDFPTKKILRNRLSHRYYF